MGVYLFTYLIFVTIIIKTDNVYLSIKYLSKGWKEGFQMKKPFSIRLESSVVNKFKALSAILNLDGASLLSELISNKEKELTEEQRNAYEALLKIWREN